MAIVRSTILPDTIHLSKEQFESCSDVIQDELWRLGHRVRKLKSQLIKYYVWPDYDVWLAEDYNAVEDSERSKSDDYEIVFAVDEEGAIEVFKNG